MMTHEVLNAFRRQIKGCNWLGSPFTARILEVLADDWDRGGAMRELLPEWPGDPVADGLPLRVAGALHALALDGRDARLAAAYSLAAPSPIDVGQLRTAVLEALQRHADHVRTWLKSAPQTNETGRSAVLLGGFSVLAQQTGLPLRLFEIGASAGLNQLWDRYHYRLGMQDWGDKRSPVQIDSDWRGNAPTLLPHIEVAERAACDLSPIDITDTTHAARLASYVWPDQPLRLARLRGAIELARQAHVHVDRADAAEWVEQHLSRPPKEGMCTVLFHSITWEYLGLERQQRIVHALQKASAHATLNTPLAWLRLEFSASSPTTLLLTCWPGREERQLARAHPHGAWAQWI